MYNIVSFFLNKKKMRKVIHYHGGQLGYISAPTISNPTHNVRSTYLLL